MIEEDRLISAAKVSPQEEALERALRPKLLSEYVGQEKIRDQLSIFIEAARARKEPLDHTLLFGHLVWAKPLSRTSLPVKWA